MEAAPIVQGLWVCPIVCVNVYEDVWAFLGTHSHLQPLFWVCVLYRASRKLLFDVFTFCWANPFEDCHRISLCFDGSPLNGEDFEVFIVYSRAAQILATLQPQVSMNIAWGMHFIIIVAAMLCGAAYML
jgi:hypothetical protein